MRVVRQNNQSIFDIAIQYCGDVVAAFEIALLNNISLTADSFDELIVPEPYDNRIVEFYRNNNINPATAPIDDIIEIITHVGEQIVTHADERIIAYG